MQSQNSTSLSHITSSAKKTSTSNIFNKVILKMQSTFRITKGSQTVHVKIQTDINTRDKKHD